MTKRSGQDILGDIDGEAGKVRRSIQRINDKISETNSELEALRSAQAESYVALSEIRFDLLEDEEIVGRLSSAEKEAKSYLEARQKARKELDVELAQNQKEQSSLEQKRKLILEKLDGFAAKVRAAEEKTLKTLDKDADFQSKLNEIEESEAQIRRIDNKIVVAKEDYAEKVVPYHNDALFMYLWQRGFGTSAYRKGALTRTLDQWVARICDYEPARRNYAMLSGIPEKLEAHKVNLGSKIEALEAEIEVLEQAAFKKDGTLKLQDDLAARKSALVEIDDKLIALEAKHHDILAQKDKFSSNSDQFYSGAVGKLNDLYMSKSLHNLRRNAAATPTKADDGIIQDLYRFEREIEEVEDDLSEYQSSLRQEEWKLSEVQNVRKTFKDKKYDSRRTTFRDGNMFTILLGQFVTGILTNTYFWSAVGRLCMEVLDELDLDDMFEGGGGYRRSRSRYRRSRSSSRRSSTRRRSGGFRTGGRF